MILEEEIIFNGLIFLDKIQEKNGSFSSFSSDDEFTSSIKKPSLFQNTLVLSSLCKIDEDKFLLVKKIKDKLANYLLDQKNKDGLFNYWDKNSEEFKKNPFPNDLDDTCCALAALHLYDSNLTTGETLAQIVSILTLLETKEGGPYRTWAVPNNSSERWKDVDLAVNSNIAYFLDLNDVSLPNLIRFVEKNIEKNSLSSPYYIGQYPIIYFISRFYKEHFKTLLARKLIRSRTKEKNILENALGLSALVNLDYSKHDLLNNKRKDLAERIKVLGWKAYPFIVELIKNKKKVFSGSSALTCALCLEALVIPKKNLITLNDVETIKLTREVNKKIFEELEYASRNLSPELKKFFRIALKRFKEKDEDGRVCLLPFFFWQSLGIPLTSKHKKLIVQLGCSNVLGWMAYSIYDDFFDQEGDPVTLSTANFCLRELTKIFEFALPERIGFSSVYKEIMDGIDSANFWEVTHCRAKVEKGFLKLANLPRYITPDKLSSRSMGHALGPICLLFMLGYKKDSSEIKNLTAFFKYYIAAKQLNDDMHDWEEDIQKGMISLPVSQIAMKIGKDQINIKELDSLRKVYWYEIMENLCKKTFIYTNKSREYLNKIMCIKDRRYFESLLLPIENAARSALTERERMIKFLDKLF